MQPADRLIGSGELGERIVHLHLRDRDVVRPVVANQQLDHARPKSGLLDRQLLHRRAPPLAQPGSAQPDEYAQRHGDQQQRHQRQQP